MAADKVEPFDIPSQPCGNVCDQHDLIVHSLSSGKVEMFLCGRCHAFTPHVNAWKR